MSGYIDLGKKPEKSMASPSKPSSGKYYPGFHVSGKSEIPGKVGSVIHAHVKLKKTSHSVNHDQNGASHSHGFDVLAIKPGTAIHDDGMDEADHMDGGKVNIQSMMESGLHAKRNANLAKARAAKSHKK